MHPDDYLREAFGDSADCGEDDEPWCDQMPGGVYAWQAAQAIGRALHALASAYYWAGFRADDDVPF